jgi:hypothetical protein
MLRRERDLAVVQNRALAAETAMGVRMKSHKLAITLNFAMFVASAPMIVRAEPNKIEYELAERCGRSVAALFKSNYGSGVSTRSSVDYEAHYNRKLNKCFYVLKTYLDPEEKNATTKKGPSLKLDLLDTLENKELGSVFSFIWERRATTCYVRDKTCQTQDEWEALVKPYMEE